MPKYEIFEDRFEFRQRKGDAWTADEIVDEYFRHDLGGRFLASFDCIEKALHFYDELRPKTWETRGCCSWLLTGTLYALEKNEYDDDDEFLQGVFFDIKAAPFAGDEDEDDDDNND